MKKIIFSSALIFAVSANLKNDETLAECLPDGTDPNPNKELRSILVCMDKEGYLIGL